MPDLLMVRAVRKQFRGTQALRGVSMSACAGEVHALMGENGAGKSTLMKIVAGSLRRDSGDILLDGAPVEMASPQKARALGVYMVQQEFSLVPHLSTMENILLGQLPTRRPGWRVDWPEARRRAADILDTLHFEGFPLNQPVKRLSVPRQQMVEIAKAVANRPRILILDEPSAVLSPDELTPLFALIRQLRDEGVLVIYISHRMYEVFELCDRITVLKDGEFVATVRTTEVDQNALVSLMVGRELSEIYPPAEEAAGAPLLQVEGLSRDGAFHNVSFSLRRGEVLGMFGLMGSGRTETARCIFGADHATNGRVLIDGLPVAIHRPKDAMAHGVALLTEDRKRDGLVLTESVLDNISMASFERMSRWLVLNKKRQSVLVAGKISELKIRVASPAQRVHQLSGGNQQKVGLAKWLLRDARILILDEPCRGVDVGTKVEIYHLMRELTARGAAILMISSEMLEILGMSDRVLVMREGALVGEVPREELSEERLLSLAAGVQERDAV